MTWEQVRDWTVEHQLWHPARDAINAEQRAEEALGAWDGRGCSSSDMNHMIVGWMEGYARHDDVTGAFSSIFDKFENAEADLKIAGVST